MVARWSEVHPKNIIPDCAGLADSLISGLYYGTEHMMGDSIIYQRSEEDQQKSGGRIMIVTYDGPMLRLSYRAVTWKKFF